MTGANLRPELAQRLCQRLDAFGEGFRHNVSPGRTMWYEPLSVGMSARVSGAGGATAA